MAEFLIISNIIIIIKNSYLIIRLLPTRVHDVERYFKRHLEKNPKRANCIKHTIFTKCETPTKMPFWHTNQWRRIQGIYGDWGIWKVEPYSWKMLASIFYLLLHFNMHQYTFFLYKSPWIQLYFFHNNFKKLTPTLPPPHNRRKTTVYVTDTLITRYLFESETKTLINPIRKRGEFGCYRKLGRLISLGTEDSSRARTSQRLVFTTGPIWARRRTQLTYVICREAKLYDDNAVDAVTGLPPSAIFFSFKWTGKDVVKTHAKIGSIGRDECIYMYMHSGSGILFLMAIFFHGRGGHSNI